MTTTTSGRSPGSTHSRFAGAERELLWRFTSASAAIGFSAQSYDFDVPNDGRLPDIDGKLLRAMWERRGAAAKAHRVDTTLARADAADRAILRDTYTPHGWSDILRDRLSLGGSRFAVCVAGLLPRSAILARVRAQKDNRGNGPTAFVDWLLEPGRRTAHESMLRNVREELASLLESALERYDALRPVRPADWRTDPLAPIPSDGIDP